VIKARLTFLNCLKELVFIRCEETYCRRASAD